MTKDQYTMFRLPIEFLRLIIPYKILFSKSVFKLAVSLLSGAMLATGKRTVTSALRIVGLGEERNFPKYHRVLSLSKWSARKASGILLRQLLNCFLPEGAVVVGIDETLERRWGPKIKARGIYRDSVRSSRSHWVKASGLRWMSVMLLVPMSWAKRVWALPFLTALAPSERYHQQQGKPHKKLTDWARQMLLQVKRWLPDRKVIAIGDSSYAAIELLSALQGQVGMIVPLPLDAALYEPALPRRTGQRGRPRKKGKRLPTLQTYLHDSHLSWQKIVVSQWYGKKQRVLEVASATAVWYYSGKPVVPLRWVLIRDPEGALQPMALLCTDQALSAKDIVTYFVRRWSVEVTFQEARAHLGVETQRQWSDLAIARTTPVLLALFAIVTLLAERLQQQEKLPIATTAWYRKKQPTFSDALACVRRHLWRKSNFYMSPKDTDMVKIPKAQLMLWQQTIAWPA
ncbi:IS701 family transposase [Tunicatimonas pelagia]|uniref:IS701 family transposase n=1 Tax=Tunicatimonas pelagia TaxID=931531 RepID=UPI002665438D|nr:transposase [Tunicatimonas pelagia]WKN44219.1 transposase [Tunicatimonas pelagia]